MGAPAICHTIPGTSAGPLLTVTQTRNEPMRPAHEGWSALGGRSMEPTGLLAEIGERVEAQIVGVDAGYRWQYI